MKPIRFGQLPPSFDKIGVFFRKPGRWIILLVGTCLVYYSVVSSLSVFKLTITKPSDLLKALSPSLVFPLLVLLKILISFWIIALISGLFRPHRISEFGAKVFGVELSHKYTGDLELAREGQEKLERQITILNDLNREVLEYLSRPFEDQILDSADKTKLIRQIVRGNLTKAYFSNCPQIKIQVIPLTEAAIESLGERLGPIVLLLYLEGVDITTIEKDKIGISIHHGEDDLGTAIIIDATDADYDLALAEICAAGTLFVAVSTIVYWAMESRPGANGRTGEITG